MKKPKSHKSHKNKKPKKKWSKQFGFFTLMSPKNSKDNRIEMKLLFKEELIAKAVFPHKELSKAKKNNQYDLYIHGIDEKYNAPKSGIIVCKGMINGLPKTIIDVDVYNLCPVLVLQRKVLIEKMYNDYFAWDKL